MGERAETALAAGHGVRPDEVRPETRPETRHAASLLAAAGDVTLLAHVNPDADALGSALALGLALHRRGAAVRVSFAEPAEVPESLRDLDVAGLVVPASAVPPAAELLVALDASSLDRLGGLSDRVANTVHAGGRVLVVDHHASNTLFGTDHVVDRRAEATAILVLHLLDALRVPVDEPIARCLYAGLVTDTRSFRNASPATHLMAARLLSAGVDAEGAVRPLLDTHPYGWLRMVSTVLGAAKLEPAAARGRGLVHATVWRVDADGVRTEDVDSVIDLIRTTAEAEVAAVFKQLGNGGWAVSLRTNGDLDISAVAVALGGGGHPRAAGFTTDGSLDSALAALRHALTHAPCC